MGDRGAGLAGRLGLFLIPLVTLFGFVIPIAPSPMAKVELGAHTLVANDHSLALAKAAGFGWVMQEIAWRVVEPQSGEYDWESTDAIVRAAGYYHLKLIFRVDRQPAWAWQSSEAKNLENNLPNAPPNNPATYAAFLQVLARRYAGRVAAYSIWNEPNLAGEWGNVAPVPEGYVALLRPAYIAIKLSDPAAIVIAGNLAPTNGNGDQAMDDRTYLRRMYAAGAEAYFDVLGAHPYGFAYPPDDAYGAHDGLNFNRVRDLRQIMVDSGDERKAIWATEFGWTTIERTDDPYYSWQRVSQEQQANYLVRAIEKAGAEWPWMPVMIVWNLSDTVSPLDEKYWYSILNDDGSPRPAYRALQESNKARHGMLGIQW